jgi:hypothetical protein
MCTNDTVDVTNDGKNMVKSVYSSALTMPISRKIPVEYELTTPINAAGDEMLKTQHNSNKAQ